MSIVARVRISPPLELPRAPSRHSMDMCDELFHALSARMKVLADELLVGPESDGRSERHATIVFHCIALLARLYEGVEHNNQLLARCEQALGDAHAAAARSGADAMDLQSREISIYGLQMK